jgi:hypothetical protein
LLTPRRILNNSKLYCSLVVFIHGGLICCGVFSILLGSICNFPNVSDALTKRGLGVASLYAYSSVLFGSTQKGRMGCFGFVMIWIVLFTLFNFRLVSHRTFSVRQITNSTRTNFNPLFCLGSSFLRIACDAEPYASSPYAEDYHSMYFDEILFFSLFGVTQAFD